MTWRKAHGAAADSGSLVVNERTPADERSAATAPVAARRDRNEHGQFVAGNGAAKRKRQRVGPRFSTGAEVHPDFKAFQRQGRRYAAHRAREIARSHGGEISAGVGALIDSAGLVLAQGRFAHWLGSQTGDVKLFRESSQLLNRAAGLERDAWELAARESVARQLHEGDELRREQMEFQRRLAEHQEQERQRRKGDDQ